MFGQRVSQARDSLREKKGLTVQKVLVKETKRTSKEDMTWETMKQKAQKSRITMTKKAKQNNRNKKGKERKSLDLPALMHHPKISTDKGSLTHDSLARIVGGTLISQVLELDYGCIF